MALSASRMAMAQPLRLFINFGMLGLALGNGARPTFLLSRAFATLVGAAPFLLPLLCVLCLYLPIPPNLRLPHVR